MTEQEPDPALYQRSRAAVEMFIARYGWCLLDLEEFVRQVMALMALGQFSTPEPASVHAYCLCLYRACYGHEGSERQEVAFGELYRYLHALSFREARDLPADLRGEIVHDAVVRVWNRLASYRKPGAFLAVCAFELRNAIRPIWRHQPHQISLDDEVAITLTAPETTDPAMTLVDSDLRQQVLSCFEEVYRAHPRAKKQLDAVYLRYAGYDERTISDLLATNIDNVYVLCSRGHKLLKSKARLQQLAVDFDILDM